MKIKRLIEIKLIEQAIKDAHEIYLNKEVETDSEAGTHSQEVIIDEESYSLYLSVSYGVIGKVVPADYEHPSEDNRELGIVTVDEIELFPQDSDIEIELGEYETQLIKSLTFL